MVYADTIVKGQAHEDTKILGQAFDAFSMSIKGEEIAPIFEEVKKKYGSTLKAGTRFKWDSILMQKSKNNQVIA
ncbi:MAG: hypothetical protein AAFR67_10255 [Chloroflexota bacterium]